MVSGFTAAGKTTHSRLLASYLGWRFLGASDFRRQLLSFLPVGVREWTPAMDRERSRSLASDRALDSRITESILRSHEDLVVDAWLQPWLCTSKSALRVWLESDSDSRVKKAAVSYQRSGLPVPSSLESEITGKDQFSVSIFEELYNLHFGYDPDLFDLIIDNTGYIGQPTIPSSDSGIASFQPKFQDAIESCLSART